MSRVAFGRITDKQIEEIKAMRNEDIYAPIQREINEKQEY